MLTKERIGTNRKLKYAAVALALVAMLVFCFTSCGKATPTAIEYVAGTAEKVEYNQGEIFDCTGAKIKVTYDNGLVEEKAVTAEMVGNAPLNLGVTAVSVTYSEEGVTIVGSIPVIVKDPYSAQREEAKQSLEANADVLANPTDKGITALILDYKAKIDVAANADAIALAVTHFQDAVTDHLTAKAEILTQLDDEELLKGLYDQFLLQVKSLKTVAVDSVKTASSIKEAESVLDSFKLAVQNALMEQEFYEGPDKNPDKNEIGGQIGDKIDLLNYVEAYVTKVNFLQSIVNNALALKEIDQDTYNKMMYKAFGGDTSYEAILGRLAWWDKYITLAINLDPKEVKDSIFNEVDKLVKTPIDELSALLAKGTTVYTMSYIDNVDKTGELLASIDAFFADATKKFGATGVKTLVDTYGVVEGKAILTTICDMIRAKHTTLTTIRNNAKPLIDIIDALPAENGAAKDAALKAAWDALKAWGTTEVDGVAVFSVNNVITNTYNNISYDKFFQGTFKATVKDGKWTSTGTWTDYAIAVDKIVMVYFLPNLQKLLDATYEQAAYEVVQTIGKVPAIGDIILSYLDKDADAGDEITAAEKAIYTYSTTYPSDAFVKFFDAKTGIYAAEVKKVSDARATYAGLIEKAALANAAIDAYEKAIDYAGKGVAAVIRGHYESEKARGLYDAYKLYCDFAKANTNSKGVVYTDVIEYSNETTKSGNESALVACMDKYVALAYAEERHVQSDAIINAAWLAREKEISLDQTDFRTALQEYKQTKINFFSTDASYDYNKTGATKTNYDEILKKNLDVIRAAAKVVADDVTAATYVNGALQFKK